MTELTIAAKLDYYMRELGAEGNSFDTIVASGLHSAMPHAVPTAKNWKRVILSPWISDADMTAIVRI